jgi:hypothetical protein
MTIYRNYLDSIEAHKAFRKASKLKKRIIELEPLILKDITTSLDYAQSIIGGRWPELEEILLKDYAFEKMVMYYAIDVAGERWPGGEEILLTSNQPWNIFKYFMHLVQKRWPEAEPALKGSNSWPGYLKIIFGDDVINKYSQNILEKILDIKTDREKWQFLEEEGITEEAVKALNVISIPRELQEYIVKKRPDLMDAISNLFPDIREKYKNELDTTGIEI